MRCACRLVQTTTPVPSPESDYDRVRFVETLLSSKMVSTLSGWSRMYQISHSASYTRVPDGSHHKNIPTSAPKQYTFFDSQEQAKKEKQAPPARIELAPSRVRRASECCRTFQSRRPRLTTLVFARHRLRDVLNHCTKGAGKDYFCGRSDGLYRGDSQHRCFAVVFRPSGCSPRKPHQHHVLPSFLPSWFTQPTSAFEKEKHNFDQKRSSYSTLYLSFPPFHFLHFRKREESTFHPCR